MPALIGEAPAIYSVQWTEECPLWAHQTSYTYKVEGGDFFSSQDFEGKTLEKLESSNTPRQNESEHLNPNLSNQPPNFTSYLLLNFRNIQKYLVSPLRGALDLGGEVNSDRLLQFPNAVVLNVIR